MNKKSDEGVSPVIAVMLMLSLTVILAALVGAYAGGFTSIDKVPQVSIRGTFSQSEGWLEVEHLGSGVVSTAETVVMISCSNTFGDASHLTWTIPHQNITSERKNSPNRDEQWASAGNVTAFMTGGSFFIAKKDLQPEGSGSVTVLDAFDFTLPQNIGKTFYVSLSQNGKVFAKTEVRIDR